MSTNIRPAVGTAVIATIAGAVVGGVVATATGRDLHAYLRFISVAVLVTLVLAGVWVYRTYMRPKGAHVEETAEADATTAQEAADGR